MNEQPPTPSEIAQPVVAPAETAQPTPEVPEVPPTPVVTLSPTEELALRSTMQPVKFQTEDPSLSPREYLPTADTAVNQAQTGQVSESDTKRRELINEHFMDLQRATNLADLKMALLSLKLYGFEFSYPNPKSKQQEKISAAQVLANLERVEEHILTTRLTLNQFNELIAQVQRAGIDLRDKVRPMLEKIWKPKEEKSLQTVTPPAMENVGQPKPEIALSPEDQKLSEALQQAQSLGEIKVALQQGAEAGAMVQGLTEQRIAPAEFLTAISAAEEQTYRSVHTPYTEDKNRALQDEQTWGSLLAIFGQIDQGKPPLKLRKKIREAFQEIHTEMKTHLVNSELPVDARPEDVMAAWDKVMMALAALDHQGFQIKYMDQNHQVANLNPGEVRQDMLALFRAQSMEEGVQALNKITRLYGLYDMAKQALKLRLGNQYEEIVEQHQTDTVINMPKVEVNSSENSSQSAA